MSYKVAFTLEGDPSHGVKAVQAFSRSLDQLAASATKSAGQMSAVFDRVRASVDSVAGSVGKLKGDLGHLATHQGFQALQRGMAATRQQAMAMASALRMVNAALRTSSTAGLRAAGAAARTASSAAASAAANMTRLTVSATAATNRLAQTQARMAGVASSTTQAQQRTAGWVLALRGVESAASRVARHMAAIAIGGGRFVGGFGQQFGRIGAQGAGSVQSMGIGIRMSGIALGTQLAQLGTEGVGGILKSIPAVAATLSELGVRTLAGAAGLGTRWAGSIVSGLLNGLSKAVPAVLTGLLGSLGNVLGQITGPILQGAGAIVGGITNLAGEIVTQLGNVFTGLVEAARGAFQGVLNVAMDLMGKMVDIVSDTVGRIAGVLGTVGKAVLGTGAVIGGFAFRDTLAADSGIAKVNVLLETNVTPKQRADLLEWSRNLQRTLGGVTPKIAMDTLERAVSTGFQGDIEGGKRLSTQALRLAVVGGEAEVAPTAARVMAKTFSLFRDEFKSADPFAEIADGIQALVNYGDLKLPEIVNRLGEILASGKAVGASFQDVMVVLAQMSQSLGVEQTFTDVRHLFTDPLKFSDKAKGLLATRGIKLNEPTEAEQARLDYLRAKLKEAESRASGSSDNRDRAAELASLRERAKVRKDLIALDVADLRSKAKAEKDPGRKAALGRQIEALQTEARQITLAVDSLKVGTAGAAEDVRDAADEAKRLRGELEAAEKAVQRTRNPLALFSDIIKAGFSPGEAADLFPNKRALVGYLVQAFQSPELAAQIEKGIRNAAGGVDRGVGIVENTMASAFSRLWATIKAPFDMIGDRLAPLIINGLDGASAALVRFSGWWEKVISSDKASAFFDRIGNGISQLLGLDRLSGVFDFIDDPASVDGFWDAMNSGVDTLTTFATQAATAVSTLWGWLSQMVSPEVSGAIGNLASGLASWTTGTVSQLASGSTANLDKLVADIQGAWRSGIDYVAGVWDTIYTKGLDLWSQGRAAFDSTLTTVGNVLEQVRNLALLVLGAGLLGKVGGVMAGAAILGGGGAGAAGGAAGGAGGIGGLGGGVGLGGVIGGMFQRALPALIAYQLSDMLLPSGEGGGFSWSGMGKSAAVGGLLGGGPGIVIGAILSALYQGVRALFTSGGPTGPEILPPGAPTPAGGFPAPTEDAALAAMFGGMRGFGQSGVGKAPASVTVSTSKVVLAGTGAVADPTVYAAAPPLYTKGLPNLPKLMPSTGAVADPTVLGVGGRDVVAKSLAMLPPAAKAARTMTLSQALAPRDYEGYTYDKTLGVYRSGMKDSGPGPFGFGYLPSSLNKKLRRAEADPKFEGGRWERFTSRGREAAAAKAAEGGAAGGKPDAAGQIQKGLDALGGVDAKRLDAIEQKFAEYLGKHGQLLPEIIDTQEANADAVVGVVTEGFSKLGGAAKSQADRIRRLEDALAALPDADTAAGNNGIPTPE